MKTAVTINRTLGAWCALVFWLFGALNGWSQEKPPNKPIEASGGLAFELESQVMQVYKQVSSGVVNITSRSFNLDFFLTPVPQEGTGSGFVYDPAGHIVTNYHVVESADELQATFFDGTVLPAKLVGADPSNDLAVLRVSQLPPQVVSIPLGDSDQVKVGRFVVAIGNPFGLGGSLTMGVVSALGRVIQSPDNRYIGEMIQTDAPINPGNSGGPLLDLRGQLIGVNSAILSPSRASAGIGFAIPVNTLKRVLPELIRSGHYPHPWLGMHFYTMTKAAAEILRQAELKVPEQGGLLVLEVVPRGPAERAGIRGATHLLRYGNLRLPFGGDFILAIQGHPIKDIQDLTVFVESKTRVGETIVITVFRDGRKLELKLNLGERYPGPDSTP